MAKTTERPAGPKARNDSYVMMLFITFVAIVAGCVLMYLDHEEYGNKQPPAAPKLADAENPKGVSAPSTVPEPKAAPEPKGMP